MIHHLFVATRDTKHGPEVLSDITGTTAVPFPPVPGSFFARRLGEGGSGVASMSRRLKLNSVVPRVAGSSTRTLVGVDPRVLRSKTQPIQPLCR